MDENQRYVLDKLYGNAPPKRAVGLKNEVHAVYTALRNTVVQRRGHQCILLGARSTGKTLVVNSALNQINSEFPGQSITIRINGLCHSDDKLALREIAKQLDAALTNGDEAIEKPSMSQTLKSINQLFDDAAMACESNQTPLVSVIFIVEELDKYASAHQVLAYELLDLSQTSPVGVTVIGTSTRMNLFDLLEKRNRSRNSSVAVTLPKPTSIEMLAEIGAELLRNPQNREYVTSQDIRAAAETVWYTTNSVRHLAALLAPRVLGLDSEHMQPSTSELLLNPIDTVPSLDWALIICAARAVVRYETESVNLVIVLDEWRAMAHASHANLFAPTAGPDASGSTGKPGSNPSSTLAVRHSWERLRKLGLIEPTASQSSQEDLRMHVPELDLDDLRELLPRTFPLYGWTKLS